LQGVGTFHQNREMDYIIVGNICIVVEGRKGYCERKEIYYQESIK